jgi:hypothetical protein
MLHEVLRNREPADRDIDTVGRGFVAINRSGSERGGSLNIGKLTFTGTVNAVAAGGQISITKSGFSIGANALLGADVSVQWGSTTIKTVSAEAQ